MTPRRIPVFFYGLFMDAEVLRTKGVSPTNIRRASVPGFALRIGQRATLLPEPLSRAHGVLMELTHDEIDRLYSEASVSMYRPEPVMAKTHEGSPMPALCFNLPTPPTPVESNVAYAEKLRALAHQLGLPPDYIRRIG